MASYKVHFIFECSPETHWGVETDDEVIINGAAHYKDGDECFDSEGKESKIKNWEDVVDDITSKWENDSLDEFNDIDQSKKNPYNNGNSEFEHGTGDTNFETTKIEIYSDINWENLIETKKL